MTLLLCVWHLGSQVVFAQSADVTIPAASRDTAVFASTVNTHAFFPQIDETPIRLQTPPENPLRKPFPGALKSDASVGKVTTEAAVPVSGVKFPGLSMNGWYPADPDIAVGPSHIVEVVNSSVAIFDKLGVNTFTQTFATMFAGLAETGNLFDPKVIYDRYNNRFVLVVIEKQTSPKISKLLVAVSDDADPNGVWHRYRFESAVTVATEECWLDYPGFGYNQDGYVFSGNLFTFVGNQWRSASTIVVPSAALLAGSPASATTFTDNQIYTIQYSKMQGGVSSQVYGIGSFNNSTFKMTVVRGITTTPTVTTRLIGVGAWVDPPSTAASTNGQTMDGGDGRLYSALWNGGKLVTSHAVNVNGRVGVRWYEIDTNGWPTSGTNPTLAQSGDIAEAGKDFTYGTILRNTAGSIGVVFSHHSTTNTASMMVAGRILTDALGTIGTPLTLATSLGANYTFGRWGDYLGIDSDPTADGIFWAVGMTVGSDNQWRTHIQSFVLEAVATVLSVTLNPTTINDGATSTGTVTLTRAAPAGGRILNLSSDTAGITVPATVTVAAGTLSSTFTVQTIAVSSSTSATITATYAGTTKSASLTVVPSTLSSVSLSAPTVVGGNQVRLTVVLIAPAPAGGTIVQLSSSAPEVLPVPITIAVPTGATTVDTLITTGAVVADTPAVVTVTLESHVKTASTIVKAPTLTGLVLAKPSITGGGIVSLRVQLDGIAPSGGAVVTLSSSDVNGATLPASVNILAGATNANVDVSTSAVRIDTPVVITGVFNAVSKSTTITVLSPVPTSLTLAPNVITGSASSTGMLILSGKAPVGGMVVSLSSSQTFASVPVTVSVAAGNSSASFIVSTTAIPASSSAVITATVGVASVNGTLTVKGPTPLTLVVSPLSIVGGKTASAVITLNVAAPAGGLNVALSSTFPAATVPASVFIPAGVTKVLFTVTSTAVPVTVSGSLQATLNGATISTTISVTSPVLKSVTFTPASVAGGLVCTGTVTLQSVAPVGGTTVTLTSANPLVVVPTAVVVPAGLSSVAFTATTSRTPTDTPVSVKASFGAFTASVTLTVLSPRIVSFLFSTSSPMGGTTVTGTVKLTTKAPAGGVTVAISNGLPGIISPSTVFIGEGFDLATFVATVPTTIIDTVVPWKATLTGAFKTYTMTIKAAQLRSVAISPISVTGGLAMVGKITLTGIAPLGGLSVLLSSANPILVNVPVTVTVPSGASGASFAITTIPVAVDETVVITASFNGLTKSATGKLLVPTVTSFALSAAVVKGGNVLSGRVYVSGAAPAGGFTVALTSGSTDVTLPATVLIPEGAKTVAFSITTRAVLAPNVVTLNAVTGLVSKSVTLTVNP